MEFKIKGVAELTAMTTEELTVYKEAEAKHLQDHFDQQKKAQKESNLKIAELEKKAKTDHEIVLKQGEVITELKRGTQKIGSEKKALKLVLKEELDKVGSERMRAGGSAITLDATKVSVADTAEYFGQRLEGVSKEPVRTPMIADLFRKINVPNGSGAKIKYIEQDVVTRGADFIPFCSTFPVSDITFDTVEEPIAKVADSIVVCNDDLEDYNFLEREVIELMQENIPLKIDEELLLGDGVAPNMNSIDLVSQVWTVAPATPIENWNGAVQDANIFDLMRSAVYQIRLSLQTDKRYNVDTILINPADMGLLKSAKDANGQPFIPYFMVGGQIVIEGAVVTEDIIVPINTMYVFDSSKGDIYISREMRIDFATQHEGLFLEDKVAWRASSKLQFIVKNQNKNAFLKVEDIATSILAITKP